MDPLIQSFLAASGEAVIRGLLAGFTRPQLVAIAGMNQLAQRVVFERLEQKGYQLPHPSSRDTRQLIGTVARSVIEARDANSGPGRRPVGASAPVYPGGDANGPLTITTRLTVRTPDGSSEDVIIDVRVPGAITYTQVATLATYNLENQLLVTSDPAQAAGSYTGVTGFSILSAYRGVPQ